MKLVFKKDEDAQVQVFLRDGTEDKEFSYVAMVKALIDDKKLEEPEMSADFTEAEVKSVEGMVSYINADLSGDDTSLEVPDSLKYLSSD